MTPVRLILALALALPAVGQTVFIRDAVVHTLAGETLEKGSVLIQDGKITGVGRNLRAPRGATVVDAAGKHLYPGMFDAYTALGLSEIGAVDVTSDVREQDDFNPQLEAIIAVNPDSEHLAVTRANGVTHALTTMSGGVFNGQAGVIHLDGWTWEEMAVETSGPFVVRWPTLRVASGSGFRSRGLPKTFDEAKKKYDKDVAEIRRALEAARHYAQALDAGGIAPEAVDRKLAALAPLVKGERPMIALADDERTMRNVIAFAEQEGLKLIIAGGEEAVAVKDLLAEKKIPVILGPTQTNVPDPDESYDRIFRQPGELLAAGVVFCFGTGSASSSRTLPYEAASATPFGLPKEAALEAVTKNPAEILGLGDRLGTIEEGKIANLILTDGDPLEITTTIEKVFINGADVSTDNRHERLFRKYGSRP